MDRVPTDERLEEFIQGWIAEIRAMEPQKPIALMLTKEDIRHANNDDSNNCITEEFMTKIKTEKGLQFYEKTSSKM